MSKQSDIKHVLVQAFVSFHAFADNALGQAMREMAIQRAGECLWALGIEEDRGIVARPPKHPKKTIDLTATKLIEQ